MRVLADFHHHALWESLRILLEDRFGWELYRPTGMEWWDAELWNYERQAWGADVAHQYLDPWPDDLARAGWTERRDRKYPDRTFRMVSLDQFREQRWDLVIATLDHNELAYAKLAREAGARFGIEIGNQWGDHAWEERPFVLSAIKPDPWPAGIAGVTLRQEFDIARQFRYEPPSWPISTVASFMQCYPQGAGYEQFTSTSRLAPEFDWRVYGAYGEAPDDEFKAGDIERVDDIADAMRATSLGWHVKRWSDGFGHVIHNWFAIGRPVFAWAPYYDGRWDGMRRIAADLFVEGVTSFDITGKGAGEIATMIRELAGDENRYRRLCEETAAHFRRTVDFDAEADAVHVLLTGEHAPVRDAVAA